MGPKQRAKVDGEPSDWDEVVSRVSRVLCWEERRLTYISTTRSMLLSERLQNDTRVAIKARSDGRPGGKGERS